jgi:hypothetical protein
VINAYDHLLIKKKQAIGVAINVIRKNNIRADNGGFFLRILPGLSTSTKPQRPKIIPVNKFKLK